MAAHPGSLKSGRASADNGLMYLLFVLIAAAIIAALWLTLRTARAGAAGRPNVPKPAPRPAVAAHGPASRPESKRPPGDERNGLPNAIAEILALGADDVMAAEAPDLLADFTILTIEDLGDARRERLVADLAAIPMPPRSSQVLLSHDFLANTATRELADLIAREPMLAAKVIGRVNSSFYGLTSPITSVSHAITFLGMNAVRTLALQFTLEQAFASDDAELKAHHARLFDAGSIAAELCSLLGGRLGFRDVGAMSTQVVLSFLGDLAMPHLLPRRAAIENWPLGLLERTCHEQVVAGFNAGIVGELLMVAWGMPTKVVAEVRAIQSVLVLPAKDADPADAARRALCYGCARLGEAIALGRVHDAAALRFADEDSGDTYHLGSYLALPGLARLEAMLGAPDLRIAVSRWLAVTARNRPAPRYLGQSAGRLIAESPPGPGGDTVIQPRLH